jgi:tRNA(Leu) C34 or U34 (ribose-2'-O)-methylase TrmL
MVEPELRSLNLSTTVGIAAYEVLRQWREGAPYSFVESISR